MSTSAELPSTREEEREGDEEPLDRRDILQHQCSSLAENSAGCCWGKPDSICRRKRHISEEEEEEGYDEPLTSDDSSTGTGGACRKQSSSSDKHNRNERNRYS